jgi:hypothetical protein
VRVSCVCARAEHAMARRGAADKRVRVGGAIRVGWSGDGHVVNDAAHRVGPWRGGAPTRLQIGPLPPCNR